MTLIQRNALSQAPTACPNTGQVIASLVDAFKLNHVLAVAGYGLGAPFRRDLRTARGAIPCHLNVYPIGVKLIWPLAARGRSPRAAHSPHLLRPAEDSWPTPNSTMVSGGNGTKCQLNARFAVVRARAVDDLSANQRQGPTDLPGDEAWLIGEHRSREKKYYRTSAATIGPTGLRAGSSANERYLDR